jgi:hypothetical protein
MLVPALLIGLFVATIAVLIVIGSRQRPQLELPPPAWPPVVEMPPELRRRRVRLVVLGLAVYAAGAAAFLSLRAMDLTIAANIVGGLALLVYLGLLITRIVLMVRFAFDARRKSAASPHGSD